jgi:hypothetical protein
LVGLGSAADIIRIIIKFQRLTHKFQRLIKNLGQWQERPPEELYPIVYLDALMVKVCDEDHIQNKAIYGCWA